jgi:hypothetical protein
MLKDDSTTGLREAEDARKSNIYHSADKVRNILAIVTVVGFIVITAVIAIVFPLFALAPPNVIIDYLRDLSSIYSGMVGLIIGYYFGKP